MKLSPCHQVVQRWRAAWLQLGATGLLAALLVVSSASAESGRIIPVPAAKLTYSNVTGLLYATVRANAASYAGRVVAINPASGQVAASIQVGGDPWELQLSDDERFLWVGVSGPKAVRINLLSNKIDLDFSTYFVGIQPDAFITDIEVLPGQPGSIVVCHYQDYGGPTPVAVFDSGVLRPETSFGGTGVSRIVFGAAPDTLWGYNGDTSGFETYRFEVDAQGVRVAGPPIIGLFDEFFLDPIFFGGLLYSPNGRAVDPVLGRPDGRFYTPPLARDAAFALDGSAEKVYFASTTIIDSMFELREYDLRSYRPTRSLRAVFDTFRVPRVVHSMVRCGPAGLALGGFESFYGYIVVLPLSILKPVPHYEPPAPQPQGPGIRRIPLPNNAIVYSRLTERVYASLSNAEFDIGNSIVPVDPKAGSVGEPVWVGSEPWQMAVSEEDGSLFVSLHENYSMVRLRLPSLVEDLRVPVFSEPGEPWPVSYPVRANQVVPLAGHPGSFALVRAAFPGADDPGPRGVVVYDNSRERPLRFFHFPQERLKGILALEPSPEPNTFYGIGALWVAKLVVDDYGIRVQSFRRDVAPYIDSESLRCQDRYCFTPYGTIIDGERQERIGEFAFDLYDPTFRWPVGVLPDLERGLVYFVHSSAEDSYVSAYDAWTLKAIGQLKLSGVREANGSLFLWGKDRNQVAVGAKGEIVLFPLSMLHSRPALAAIPDIEGKRLYIPFFRADLNSFTGIAISNPGQKDARVQWTLVDVAGGARQPGAPVDAVLSPNQQTASLATEIFGIPFGNGVEYTWIEIKSDSDELGSFFQFGTRAGLDGSVALSDPAGPIYFTRMFQGPASLLGRPATTTFGIANPNGFAIDLRVTAFTEGRRSVDPPKQTVRLFRLPAKGYLYDTIFGQGGQEFSQAYVKVEALDEGAGIVGFGLVDVDGGESVIGLAEQTEDAGDTLYSAQLAYGAGIFTNLKLVNLSGGNRSLVLRAIADDGSDLAPALALTLRPGAALERDVTEIFSFSLSAGVGSLEVACDGPGVVGDVIFGEPESLRFVASLPLQKRPFRKAVFSQVANRHDFFTGLAFFNPASIEARIQIEVFAENGTRTGQRTVSLAPGARLSRLLDQLVPSSAGQERGFVKVESDVPLIGQQLFGDYRLSRLSAVPPRILDAP